MSIRIVIADDQGMIRAGLRSLLSGEPDLDVVAEAADGEQAVHAVRRFSPDVALMDIRMPKVDGIAATRRIAEEFPATRVVMLTTFDLDAYVFEALRAGASGFLLKDAPVDDLLAAVRIVAEGDGLLAPRVTRRVIEAFGRLPVPDPQAVAMRDDLSRREDEVLQLLARGLTNNEIASELIVSEATVKSHVSNVLAKLRLRDRVQAVIFAYESGMVVPD